MIGVYDKGLIDSTFIQDVIEYARVRDQLNDLQKCEIVVVHVSDEEWNSLIKQYSCSSSVRVRVSTAGFSYPPPPTISRNDVYVFHLVPPTKNLETQWENILDGLSDKATVTSLVRGENPNRLRRFFVHEVYEHLPALTILCEGYLAVYAENPDCHTDIGPALDIMKWIEFRKSERGQNLIRQNLCEKMSDVQQPQWWLNVFEQESFCDDVKKEWKNTTGTEEIPAALSNLLKAIRISDTIVPPKIVARAYCILEKKIITAPSEWQTRRNKFNHDWLKNKFLNSLDDFIVELGESGPDIIRLSEFLEKDFAAWEYRQQDAQWIVQSFEDSMSPQRFMESAPLNRCDGETQTWLGRLVHELWLSRYPVKSKVQESQDALVVVNKIYEKIAFELEQSEPIELTKLIALHSQFCELRETYQVLSKTLSALLQEV